MLKLKKITKNYAVGNSTVEALRGVSLEFRKNEFVSILGQSGCGKTTLLNIIGGLDRYTDGDLIINGKSTKTFKDSDWDTYRNHSIGFVFQSYNLIPHQSVLSNVELALTLSGVSKSERRRRAINALEQVGLGDQIHKKPSQMSGGQMQRVAIARALVNNPDILLADEPTGALDTNTSIQIMDILKEISKDKLIIMVTHNPDLAETYSSRIIKLLDGVVIDDSNPYTTAQTEESPAEIKAKAKKKATDTPKKPSMSFLTALSLSFNNLRTKKGRTAVTSFAGSIGIIGIALILALSSGINLFITDIQKDTLSSFPITILEKEKDMSAMLESMTTSEKESNHANDAVYSSPVLFDLVHNMTSATEKTNNLKAFKEFLDNRDGKDIDKYISAVQYTYNVDLNMYTKADDGNYNQADFNALMSSMMGTSTSNSLISMGSSFSTYNTWCEILPGAKNNKGEYTSYVSEMVSSQYDVVYGKWPEKANEVVLVLNKNNEITDLTLYSLGLITEDEIMKTIMLALKGDESYQSEYKKYSYEDICSIKYKLLLSAYHYEKDTSGLWRDMRDNNTFMKSQIDNKGYDVSIVGIVKPNSSATTAMLSGSLAYTAGLTEYVITETNKTDIAKEQLKEENANYDIFTGLKFVNEGDVTDSDRINTLKDFVANSKNSVKAKLYYDIMCTPSAEYIQSQSTALKDMFMSQGENTDYREMLANLIIEQNLIEGMDHDAIMKLMAGYTEEELEEMVDGYLKEFVINDYYESQKAEIIAKVSEPTPEAIAAFKMQIYNAIITPDKTNPMEIAQIKAGFVANSYATKTGLPIDVYLGMIMSGQISVDTSFDTLLSEMALEQYAANVKIPESQINEAVASLLDEYIKGCSNKELLEIYKKYLPDGLSENSYEDNLAMIGICDLDNPASVNIYSNTFESKDMIAAEIEKYNSGKAEEDKITYTDYVAILMSSVTTIINVISYVLIGFVSVSLVVSSIMIGIITNISVLERTKEIGILRAIGASKKDVSRVFNAETFIIGLLAGIIGIATTVLLCIPTNIILRKLTGFNNITAYVPWQAGIILVAISVILTLVAGLIPARSAAKKDPVIALRTE